MKRLVRYDPKTKTWKFVCMVNKGSAQMILDHYIVTYPMSEFKLEDLV